MLGTAASYPAKLSACCILHTDSNTLYQSASSRRCRPRALQKAWCNRRCCPAVWIRSSPAIRTRPVSKQAARSYDDEQGSNAGGRSNRQGGRSGRDKRDKPAQPAPELTWEEIQLREMLGADYQQRIEEEKKRIYIPEPPPGPGFRLPRPQPPPKPVEPPKPPPPQRQRKPREARPPTLQEALQARRRANELRAQRGSSESRESLAQQDAQSSQQQDTGSSQTPKPRTRSQQDAQSSQQQEAESSAPQDLGRRIQQQAAAAKQQGAASSPPQDFGRRIQQQAESTAQPGAQKSAQKDAETAAQPRAQTPLQRDAETARQQAAQRSVQQDAQSAQQDARKSFQQKAETKAQQYARQFFQESDETAAQQDARRSSQQDAESSGQPTSLSLQEEDALTRQREAAAYRRAQAERLRSTPVPSPPEPRPTAEVKASSRDDDLTKTLQARRAAATPAPTPDPTTPPSASDPSAMSEAASADRLQELFRTPQPGSLNPSPTPTPEPTPAPTPPPSAAEAPATSLAQAVSRDQELTETPPPPTPPPSTSTPTSSPPPSVPGTPSPSATDPNARSQTQPTPTDPPLSASGTPPPPTDPNARSAVQPTPTDPRPTIKPQSVQSAMGPPTPPEIEPITPEQPKSYTTTDSGVPLIPPASSATDPVVELDSEGKMDIVVGRYKRPLKPILEPTLSDVYPYLPGASEPFTRPQSERPRFEPEPPEIDVEESRKPEEEDPNPLSSDPSPSPVDPNAIVEAASPLVPELAQSAADDRGGVATTTPAPMKDAPPEEPEELVRDYRGSLIQEYKERVPAIAKKTTYEITQEILANPPKVDMYLTPVGKAARSGKARLTVLKLGYHIFRMEGCEFLIGTSDDGRLDLNDIYVMDEASELYAEPSILYGTPQDTARYYQAIEWADVNLPDTAYDKPASRQVRKIYLIGAKEWAPRRKLDFNDVWMLDGRSRSMQKQKVEVRVPVDPGYDKDIILRIGRDGTMIAEEERFSPGKEDLIAYYDDLIEREKKEKNRIDSLLREQGFKPAEEIGHDAVAQEAAALDPFERMDDDFDEPDVPAIDLA